MNYNCVFIVGPTGSGKSKVAINIAKSFNGQIINADSMQIYKNFGIGTAKPSLSDMQIVPHHLYGFQDENKDFSVSEYKDLAINKFNELKNICLPIFVGGTGLYFNSLINNYNFSQTDKDENLRKELQNIALLKGNEYLHKILEDCDPVEAEKIPFNNVKRVIRAIEIFKTTGKTKTELNNLNNTIQPVMQTGLNPLIIGINYNREELYSRINNRVDIMVKNGLIEEAKQVFLNKDILNSQFSYAIAYKEFFKYFNNEDTLDNCINLLKQKSRNYAKRQLTWFNKMENVNWFNLSNCNVDDILNFIKNKIK